MTTGIKLKFNKKKVKLRTMPYRWVVRADFDYEPLGINRKSTALPLQILQKQYLEGLATSIKDNFPEAFVKAVPPEWKVLVRFQTEAENAEFVFLASNEYFLK